MGISVAAAPDKRPSRQKNPTEIEFAVRDLVAGGFDAATFPYDLLAAYNATAMTVARLRSGSTNKATKPGDVLWQKRFFFRSLERGRDLKAAADEMIGDAISTREKPRFVFVTDGFEVYVRDLKLNDAMMVDFERLDEEAYFLLPLAGYERRVIVEEHQADRDAAKRLKKLYDALLAVNPTWNTGHHTHELNLLMTRLLFCFYAEATGIFEIPKIFSRTVQQTVEDGSDVAPLLSRLFEIMNVAESERSPAIAASERRFPYVNGSLFEQSVEIPVFNRTARRQLLECGDLDWTTINPDIFGSMIQTIARDVARSDLGMHYTNVPNIMKVLQPLFLDDLNDAFEKSKDNVSKLEMLLGRLTRIRVFDPACGSGNFLVIAYKALREIETRILIRIGQITPSIPLRLSGIVLENFFGIDIVDFACETTKLSLWIAEHQCNSAFRTIFGIAKPVLPLAKIATIHRDNALIADWLHICPKDVSAETYLCGNPPYLGTSMQTVDQKRDLATVFSGVESANANLDYISGWLFKGKTFIKSCESAATVGLVTTNSVCQGEHIPLLWPALLSDDVSIVFAHTSFKWGNQAAHNAGVSCVIVGLGKKNAKPKRLYTDDVVREAKEISPYLLPFPTPIIEKRTLPLSAIPIMTLGSQPSDGGNFMFGAAERRRLIEQHPESARLLKRYVGSKEFVQEIERWTLWIPDEDVSFARSIPEIDTRLERIVKLREMGGTRAKPYVSVPHRYVLSSHRDVPALIVPTVTSESRRYLAVGLLDAGTVISNLAYAVYDPPAHILSLLSSRMHMLWTLTIGGHLENRVRYSNQYVYNSFPVPELSETQRSTLANYSRSILRSRARNPGKTIASLYNPGTMPKNLLEAHQENDVYIEQHVYGRAFEDDYQRLEYLFAMFGRMLTAEAASQTLFESSGE